MASEEEVVRFIFNGANEMAELMYQLKIGRAHV